MKNALNSSHLSAVRRRNPGAWSAALATAALLFGAAGCNTDEAMRAFRSSASTQLEAGVQSIASGVISGAFAAFELGTESTDSTTTTP
ncbi:MAG: hypothetical protein HZB38_01215 [Planctomycetes bacterium]|nr:hypothetical protein [Planctomycetota bacterium]